LAGVPTKTIRFWEDQHLLPPPARTPAGYRDYDPAILERLAFIRHAQAAGLTLDAIRQVLDISDGGQPPCVHVAGLIARRLTEVEARLAELALTRDQLAALAARAAAQDPADCRGYCSIITAEAPPAAAAASPARHQRNLLLTFPWAGRRRIGAMKITRDEVRRLVEAGAQLVEVLPWDEFDDEHLPGAISLPLKSLTAETSAVLDRSRPVIVYCWDGL
jgi:MerR family transcriptional regulator, copper efflux regulator